MLALTLELERGAVATVQVVWQRDDLPRTYELDVIGDGARVEAVLDPEFHATGLADGAPVDLRDPARRAARPGALPGGRARRRSRRGGVHARPQATSSLATALACEQALKSGGRVTVDAPRCRRGLTTSRSADVRS